MELPEELAADIIAGEHYNNFLLGKPIAEDKLSGTIADAIRLAYLEGVDEGKRQQRDEVEKECDDTLLLALESMKKNLQLGPQDAEHLRYQAELRGTIAEID